MTFSIIARDDKTENLWGGVSSHWFKCHKVLWWKSWVWIVATQVEPNYSYWIRGLELLKEGLLPEQCIKKLTLLDDERNFRQLWLLDKTW